MSFRNLHRFNPPNLKEGENVAEALKKILKCAKGQKPQKPQMDDREEFYNGTFQNLRKIKAFYTFQPRGNTKASMAERFKHTMKDGLYRYVTKSNSLKYLNILQALIDGYNQSYNRSTAMKPSQVNTENMCGTRMRNDSVERKSIVQDHLSKSV